MFRGDAAKHNPEEMLVAALATCHMLAYLHLATLAGVVVTAYTDSAEGTMVTEGNGGHFTEVVLRPVVTITAVSDSAKATAAHEEAHHACFIAASVNFPVRCEPRIVIENT
jgi:organic hydroperoxide reductase OsmC/OhrA